MSEQTAMPSMARRAMALNARLESLMPLLTPIGVGLGFLFSPALIHLRPLIPWLFGTMTLSGALKLRARDLGAAVTSPMPVVSFFIAAHALMPVIAFAVSRLALPAETDVAAGFVLLFSTPTAVSGFIWVSIFHGDGALALAIILLDTLAAPFIVPLTTSTLLGTSVAIDAAGMALSLVGMVVIPTIIGVVLNETSRGGIPARVSPFLTPLAKIFMIFVVSANSAAVAPKVALNEPKVWIVAAIGIFLAVMGFLLGRLVGLIPGIGRPRTRSLFFNIGLRNITAAATLAIAFFPEAAALPAILGMIFQQTLAAVSGRIFLGKPSDEEER